MTKQKNLKLTNNFYLQRDKIKLENERIRKYKDAKKQFYKVESLRNKIIDEKIRNKREQEVNVNEKVEYQEVYFTQG